MNTLRKASLAAAITAALSFGNAQAGTIANNLFVGFQNKLSDNSAEYLLNDDDGVWTPVDRDAVLSLDFSSGQIDVGDRIRAIYEIESIEKIPGPGSNSLGSGSGNNELTAIGDFVVLTKTESSPGSGLWKFTFGPYAPFATELAGLSGGLATAGDLLGAMFGIFEDPSQNFSRTGASVAADELTATNGIFRAALGFTGGLLTNLSEYFGSVGFGSDNVGDALFVPDSTSISQTGFGLNFIVELFPDVDFGLVLSGCGPLAVQVACNGGGFGTLVGVNGSGPTNGIATLTGPATEFDVFDDINFTVFVQPVPEPTTLALLGLGLLGTGLRRKKMSV